MRTSAKSRFRALFRGWLVVSIATITSVALTAPAQAATYTTGHFDLLDVDYSGSGSPTIDVKQYSPINDDLSPSGNTFRVPAAAQSTLGSGLSCIGSSSSQVYRLPQTLNSNLLYAGWNAQDSTGNVTLELVSASVPSGAKFALYQAVTGGTSIKLNTTSGGCNLSSFTMSSGTHAHANWVFTQAGTYTLTFRAKVGSATSSNVAYTFSVG
ncbi:MAG: choice-of-anchor M domain-containing protein [Actinomycetota bacterium]